MGRADVEAVAAERFGVRGFRPGQRELIDAVLAGRDALGVLPTGAGKSLTYQLPALLLPGTVVVVSPLIALMQDQTEKMEEADIPVARLDSTLTGSEERQAAREIRAGEPDLVYVTPERLENAGYLELLRRRRVSLFVVDEAHCVSQWGHDFRPAYLALRAAARELGRPPILALTATATRAVEEDVGRQLELREPVVVRTGIERENLAFSVAACATRDEKVERLARALGETDGPAIAYVATVRRCDELHALLGRAGVRAERYHGKMRPNDREASQRRFMEGGARVVVATNAFGLGIDKPDIRAVVHYHLPGSLEAYYQEAGRAGRDGEPARALLLLRAEDRRIQAFFLGGKYPSRADALRFHGAVAALSGGGRAIVPLEDVARRSGLAERRVKVLAALLENGGLARRERGRLRLLRPFGTEQEFSAFLDAYDARRRGDRERLDAMMRYGRTTLCRMRVLREYFGEAPGRDCGRCDNCASGRAAIVHQVERAHRAPRRPQVAAAAAARFREGQRVRHDRFGEGAVVGSDDAHVTVAFERAGRRTLRPSYLEPAPG